MNGTSSVGDSGALEATVEVSTDFFYCSIVGALGKCWKTPLTYYKPVDDTFYLLESVKLFTFSFFFLIQGLSRIRKS